MPQEENQNPIVFQEELFSQATQAALEALSQILNQKVSLGAYALGKIHQWPTRWREIYMQPQEGFWLQTNLQGELLGHSFLWIGKEEAEQLGKHIFKPKPPKEDLSSEKNDEKHTEGAFDEDLLQSFLLELDNILSAHFIKFWANQNQLRVYGDIPHLYKDIPKVLQDSLTSDAKLPHQWFYLEFVCVSLNINLEFTWLIHTESDDLV